MIPEVNIISGKASEASINRARGSGEGSESLSGDFRGWSPLKKFLGSKEHLKYFEIDLNEVKIITVQDYKSTKHQCGWKYI